MITTLTRASHPDVFDLIHTIDYYEESYSDHRRGSNFYTRWVFDLDETLLPSNPELWGFWETNTFIRDSEYGSDFSDIMTLTRVEKITKMIEVSEWAVINLG